MYSIGWGGTVGQGGSVGLRGEGWLRGTEWPWVTSRHLSFKRSAGAPQACWLSAMALRATDPETLSQNDGQRPMDVAPHSLPVCVRTGTRVRAISKWYINARAGR